MRRLIQIHDGTKEGWLTLTYLDAVEQWLPDQPGFVKAAKKFDDNPANEISESAWNWMDVFLFTETAASRSGRSKPEVVIKLRKVRRVHSQDWDNKSGTGELSMFGAAKLRWGTLKWWLL